MKNILVPTDFSPNANNAVEYASVIANTCKSAITLFTVYTPAVTRYNVISPLIADEVEQAKIELHEKLQLTARTIQALYPGVRCHMLVGVGETVEEILNAVKSEGTDIVIMGTQGASSIEKVLLGSNAADIIEKADCPVLVIPANTTCKIPKKILFATDYAYSDIENARKLVDLAQAFDATVTLIHVTAEENDIDDELKLIEKFSEEIKTATKYQNINSKILSDNTVLMGLDSILQDSGADIVALSTRKRNLFEKIFNRSLTKKLAHYTRIPLMAFKVHSKEEY